MKQLLAFLRYAVTAIGWEVEVLSNPARLVAKDLHGNRYTITVAPCV